MKRFKVGLVVGKFCPLHRGHELVINTALEECDEVLIISYTSRDLGYSATLRRQWLEKRFPTAHVRVFEPDDAPDDDASDYAQRSFCFKVCNVAHIFPDAVFSSEEYGAGFAAYLSSKFWKYVTNRVVDIDRMIVPISGTRLREDESLWNEFVHDDVRSMM